MDDTQYKIPLGLCKQAVMKLDSVMSDIHEIMEDPDVEPEDRDTFNTIAETIGLMEAHIINIVRKECDEDEFLSEDIAMDEIESFPGDNSDILDDNID